MKPKAVLSSLGLVFGMAGFALCAHAQGLLVLRLIFLACALVAIAGIVAGATSLKSALGLGRPTRATWIALPIAAGGGVLLAVWYRLHQGQPALPPALASFCGTAIAIGAAEELVYRGLLLHSLRQLPLLAAALLSALAHAIYKSCLFVLPAPVLHVDFVYVGIYTAALGLVVGAATIRLRSLWIALAVHVAFDVVVYGDRVVAPWWVW